MPAGAVPGQSGGVMINAMERLPEELHPPLEREAALLEADRCLECGGPYAAAPCTVGGPADADCARFVSAIADDDVAAAAETIFAENLLGATCARVCPTEVLCEGACVLVDVGRLPIRIGALQRYATDRALADGAEIRSAALWNGRRGGVFGAGPPRPARRVEATCFGPRAGGGGGGGALSPPGPAGLVCAGELAALGYGVTIF